MAFFDWLNRLFADQPAGVRWARYTIPHDRTNHHFLAAGTTGTGKTTLLRLLLHSVVPDVARDESGVRVLLYDPKSQWNTELVDLGLEPVRKILNPFDARSVAWDIAADISNEADAAELAAIFFPQVEGDNRFFYGAARKLVKAVIMAFISLYRTRTESDPKKNKWGLARPWQLRDVLLACANLNDLSLLLARADLPTDSVDEFLTEEREARSVRMTVTVENDAYNAIAMAWHSAEESVSLDDWVSGQQIWLLGASKKYRYALSAFNRLMLQRLQQLTLEEPTFAPNRRSWFVLDEFPGLGRIPHLEELLTEGRERGVCVVLAFQHIAHVRELYKGLTEALLGQCHHQAYFRA